MIRANRFARIKLRIARATKLYENEMVWTYRDLSNGGACPMEVTTGLLALYSFTPSPHPSPSNPLENPNLLK